MINLSQIARHFSTDNDQKRSICPKLIAALAQAKSPPNHAPRKGIPGGCGNTPCPKSIATPVLLGIVWRVSAAFLGDAVLNGTVRGMLWRACPSSKGKNHPSSPIVSRRAPSSLPRILRAAPGWSSAISANSLGWTSPIGRKEPSPPYWRSNAPADGVEPFRSPGHLASAYSVPPVPPYAKRKAFLCLRGRLSVSFDAGCAVIAPLRVFSCGG